jgi:threonine/homoserine/homoserine lactone efflux protein
MTDEISFILSAFALLATPGPTNTLLATSGAASGFRKSIVLVPGEIFGYLTAVAFLIAVVGPVVTVVPSLGFALRIATSLYLLHAARKLWGHSKEILLAQSAVRLHQVFVTTLLNPKAVLFAFTIIPFDATGNIWGAIPWLAALSLLIAIVGSCWIVLGATVQRGMGVLATPRVSCRAGAIVLILFAALVSGTAMAEPWTS